MPWKTYKEMGRPKYGATTGLRAYSLMQKKKKANYEVPHEIFSDLLVLILSSF
jgi:hypothetical protein